MTSKQYLINSRPLNAIHSLAAELTYDPGKNYLFDLSFLSVLDVVGEKSGEFLQGQLSCDVREVNAQQMRAGVMCNLKGRILALLDVIDWQGMKLILPDDLLQDTQASLNKTAMFSKVKLAQSHAYQLIGLYVQNSHDLVPLGIDLPKERFGAVHTSDYYCYALGNNSYILLVRSTQAGVVIEPFKQTDQWRGSLGWHALQLQQGRLQVYPESRGLFLPHRLDLHLSGYLNFNKGCYKGQEIIARTHYRAKLKHEMKRLTMESLEPLFSGKKLLAENSDVEYGEIIDFCPLGNHNYLVAASVLIENLE